MVKFGAVIKGVGHMAKWVTGIKLGDCIVYLKQLCICGSLCMVIPSYI